MYYQVVSQCVQSLKTVEVLLDKAEQFATRASGLYRELFGDDNESTLNSLQLLARAYGASGKRTQSIELLERVRDAQAKALGAENPQTLRTIYHLAREHLQAGHRRQAIDMLEAVRDAQVKKLGPNHLDTLATEGELADVYRGLGETAKAIELLEQILQVQVKELGADHPSALHTMGRQAYAYWLAGKSPQAIDLLKKVSAIQQQKLGPNHPETLYTLCDLAEAYIRAAMLPQGIEILERVRDVRIGRLGKEHPDTLYTLNQLGGAYLEANKVSQAIELLEQVRDIQTKKLGPDHDDTLSTMNYLAGAYEDAGRMPEAIALFEQLRDTTQKLLGTNSQNAIIAQYALGDAYRKAGNPARALAPFRQAAVGIEKQKFQNLLAERSVMNLVSCLDQCHLYDEALLWIQKWSDGVKQRDGAESRTYAKALENHGVYLLRWERGAEAVDPIRECLALRERLWPDEPATSRVRGMLGDALLGAQRYDDAESVLLSAKAALTRGYRSEVERYRKACGNADPMALNGVAWLLATCEDAAVRDGPTAVTYAEKAVAATNRKDPVILDTLAAAYAETGEFEKAIDVQKEAIALAHDDSTKNEFRLRQELYAVKVPYRELPKDWGMFMANLILGKVFLRQQKYVDAEATLLSAYEGFKLGRHRANPAAKDIIRTLIELYEVTARADKLAEWRAELTQWYRGQIDEYRRAAESGDAQGLIVAWLLATCEDAAVRDGPTAVTYAVRAVAATNRKDPLLLDTLAAAYAETGDFEKAVGVEKEAMALAQSDSLREDFASRLKLYESNTPFREP